MNKQYEHYNKLNVDNIYWKTKQQDVETLIPILKRANIKTIWCPADTKDSNFVKVLKVEFKVYHTHIEDGQDYYEYEPDFDYDIIITNPPFKGKKLWLERTKHFNKPFIFIYGIQCFNSGGFNQVFAEVSNPQIIMLKRRMKFYMENENEKSSPSFHSFYLCNGVNNLPSISYIE